MYLDVLIRLIENRRDAQSKIWLLGLLNLHIEECEQAQQIQNMQMGGTSVNSAVVRAAAIECPCMQLQPEAVRQEDFEIIEQRWFLLVKSIIYKFLELNSKSSNLTLLSAFIHHEKLKKKYKALRELMITEVSHPTIQEEFSIYNYKNLYEEDIIISDIREESRKSIDVNSIVSFQNQFVVFKKSLEQSVEMHMDFWQELLEQKPDIQKLHTIGSKINSNIDNSAKQFKILSQINSNNARCLDIYANYLKNVVSNEDEAYRIMEKIEYITQGGHNQYAQSSAGNDMGAGRNKVLSNEQVKYGQNSNTGVITMSGNLANFCNITNANHDITRILGYTKHEIIDQNILRIIPKALAEVHDDMVNHFIETSIPKAIGVERLVLPVTRHGFVVPSMLMIKILPNLEDGLQFVGFIKEFSSAYCPPYELDQIKDQYIYHYIAYNIENQTIVAMTQTVNAQYGVPVSLINNNSPASNEFTIDMICPTILDSKIQEDMRTEQGAVIQLDTTIISQQFLLSKDSTDDKKLANLKNNGQDNTAQNNNNISKLSAQQTNNISRQQQQNQMSFNQNNSKITNNGQSKVNKSTNQQENYADYNDYQQDQEEEGDEEEQNLSIENAFKKVNIRVFLVEDFVYKQCQIQIIKFMDLDKQDFTLNQKFDNNMSNKQTSSNVPQNKINVITSSVQKSQDSHLSYGNAIDKSQQQKIMDQQLISKQLTMQNPFAKSTNLQQSKVQQQQILLSSNRSADLRKSQNNASNANNNNLDQSLVKSSVGINDNKQNSDIDQKLNQKNEEIRQIKDVKMAISERNEPSNIKILKMAMLFLYVFLVSMQSVNYIIKEEQSNELVESSTAIYTSLMRHTIMAEINYYSRKLNMIANNVTLFDSNDIKQRTVANLQEILYKYTNNLQLNQFNIMQQKSLIEDRKGSQIDDIELNFTFLLQTGILNNDKYYFSDGVLQFIIAGSYLSNSSITTFVDNDLKPTAVNMQFDYITRVGLFKLRQASEQMAKYIYDFYFDQIGVYQTIFRVIMILCIVFLVAFLVILIPIVFSVNNTSNNVLIIFSLIPLQEIKNIVNKCLEYKQDFLDEKLPNQSEEQQPNEEIAINVKEQQNEKEQNDQIFKKLNYDQQNVKKTNNQPVNNNNNISQFNDNHNEDSYLITQNQINNNNNLNTVLETKQAVKQGNSKNINKKFQQLETNNNNNNGNTSFFNDASHIKLVDQNNSPTKLQQSEQKNIVQSYIVPQPQSESNNNNNGFTLKVPNNNNLTPNQQQQLQYNNNLDVSFHQQKIQEEKAQVEHDDDMQDYESQRQEGLLNKSGDSRRIVVLKTSFFALIFILFYVIDYILQANTLEDIRLIYHHIQLTGMRPSYVKYSVLFTLEEITQRKILHEDEQDIQSIFSQRVYQYEDDLVDSVKSGFPSYFQNYLDLYRNTNFGDICSTSLYSQNTIQQNECYSVQQGILKKGLRTSIISLSENSRSIITNFRQTSLKLNDAIKAANSTEFQILVDMQKFIVPALHQLNDKLVSVMNDYLDNKVYIEQIVTALYLVVLTIVGLFILLPFVNNLTNTVLRTKGMLNMIPMDLILNYERLRLSFKAGGILKTVK